MRKNRVEATERVYDVLHDAGLNPDHQCFDDLMIGCMMAAETGSHAEVVEIIVQFDTDERSPAAVAFDLVDYARNCGVKNLDGLITKAVAIAAATMALANED